MAEPVEYLALLAKKHLAYFPKLVSNNKLPRYLIYVSNIIQSVVEGPKTDKPNLLILSCPPRHGKTEIVSKHFPAWYLGKNPKKRILMASYSDSLACFNNAKAKDIFSYWAPQLWGTEPNPSIFNQSNWETSQGGGCVASGIGGAFTGFGADVFIIDDYIKNPEEAESELVRNKIWEWWGSVANTRLHPGATIIILATRWHCDDLIGHLLKDYETAKEENTEYPYNLTHINLKALAEENDPLGRQEGAALWPWWMNENVLRNKKTVLGSAFSALYQGDPISRDGSLFKETFWRYYEKKGKVFLCYRQNEVNPIEVFDTELIRECFIDPNIEIKKENDPMGLAAWGYSPIHDIWLLLEAKSVKIEHTKVNDYIIAFAQKHGCINVNVENEKLGKVLVKTSFGESPIPFSECPTGGLDKYARATTMARHYENERVFLPKYSDWVPDYTKQLIKFPRDKHDEFVDVTSMASKMETGLTFAEILARRA